MALSTALRRVSQTLIAKNGRAATLVHRPAGVFDPDSTVDDAFNVTTGMDASAELKEAVSVIIEAGKRAEEVAGAGGVPSSTAQRQVRSATLAAKGLVQAPTERDELRFGTETWMVVLVETVEHEGLPILYKCQIRR